MNLMNFVVEYLLENYALVIELLFKVRLSFMLLTRNLERIGQNDFNSSIWRDNFF